MHTVDSQPHPETGVRGTVTGDEARFLNDSESARRERAAKGEEAWWIAFGSRDLNEIEEKALTRNPDVRAISRQIVQANARLVQAGSTLFPQVNGAGEYRRSWNLDGSSRDTGSIGLTLDWELDVWGRIRYGRDSRAEEAAAAYEDWLASRLLLSAAVAEVWFGLIEQRGQLALAREQIGVNDTLLELTQLRFGQGQGSSVDVLQQRQQTQAIEALIPDIEARIEQFELVLDALTGHVSGTRKRVEVSVLPSPPTFPNAGYPSDLLQERPDLRAQEARIVAVDHEVGEAIAERLPRFSVGGALAVAGGPGLDTLIGDAVAAAVGPILDGGARRAEVELRKSRVREEVDLYTALFIDAVREVETALSSERRITERIRRQEEQLATTRKLLVESRIRYSRGGITDYLPVLDAVTRVQDLERDLLTSRRERLSARVALHRALGGPMVEPSFESVSFAAATE